MPLRPSSRSIASRVALAAIILACVALAPIAARAGALGYHAGFSLELDQLLAGIHASIPIGERNLYFVPDGDFGVFNGTSFVLHTDLQFRLGGKEAGFTPYVAAGGTWWGFDPEGDNGSDSQFGPNVAVGAWRQKMSGKKSFAEVMFFLDSDRRISGLPSAGTASAREASSRLSLDVAVS